MEKNDYNIMQISKAECNLKNAKFHVWQYLYPVKRVISIKQNGVWKENSHDVKRMEHFAFS